ncbi:MAG TPA: zincin-like metallopeptidase domain-containing protein [Terriglobales bacterium]|jgi:antirestriction protein ArdC|nr:zincin-like metallopeptidase domain-containing protein [Terriglobales bacterium]
MPSVYEIVTEKIIKQLESGVAPWRKPWTCQTPENLLTQKEYRGLNVFTLASQGFPSRFWLTYNQATKLGGRIRKGEKSSPVIFWNIGDERETIAQDGAKETSRPFLLRYYSVFNLSQAEGIDIPASLLQETRTTDPIETCEQLVANMPNPPAFEQSDKAWYSPTNDVVGMPARGLFHSSEEYYATVFHELAHSTGHAKRLRRENFDNPVSFGSESYSKEELIAEMTAAMLCGIAGMEQRILENAAAYLKTWIARLKSDSRLLVSAAAHAQKAADFIQGKAPHGLAAA